MENAIVVLVLIIIVGAIALYLWKAKKRGEKCIGCPYCKQCSGKCNENREQMKINNIK